MAAGRRLALQDGSIALKVGRHDLFRPFGHGVATGMGGSDRRSEASQVVGTRLLRRAAQVNEIVGRKHPRQAWIVQ